MRRWLIAVGLCSVLVAACGGSKTTGAVATGTVSSGSASSGASGSAIDGLLVIDAGDPKTDQAHVNGTVTYSTSPPTRGPHNAIWQNCGFYTKAVANENAVHSLEHGAIWITYREDADEATRSALAAMAKANTALLITPYANNPTPIVLSGWGRQLQLEQITDPRVAVFIATFARKGPNVPEPGASCSGALGVPPDRPSTMAS